MLTDNEKDPPVFLRPLDTDLHDSFEKLLSLSWEQNWSGDLARQIVRWRYYERPAGHVTWVACVGNDCVAMLDSRISPYLLYGKRVMVRETADWFCLPQYRQFGLGLRVLRQLRNYPEPVLVVGGSDMTQQILPRLGWNKLAPVRSYILPVAARGLAANMIRRKWPTQEALARMVWRRVPFRSPARLPAPPGEPEMQLLTRQDWAELPGDTASDLVGLLDRTHWEWLLSMPSDFARALGAVFRLNGTPVGFALVQLEPTATGLDGRIVHVQVCRSDVPLLAWIFSATARILVEHGAEFIRCYVSTPEKIAAIESVGFMLSQEQPCHWWNRPGVHVPGKIDIDYLRGDDALPLAAMRGRKLDKIRSRDRGEARLEDTASPVRI